MKHFRHYNLIRPNFANHCQVPERATLKATIHELSIVQSIVETATESARQAKVSCVLKVDLRLGALSGEQVGSVET